MIIPGQSLTAEPKNAPYENPPMYNTADEALRWHLKSLTPKRTEAGLEALELNMLSIQGLVEGLMRMAVMEGIHSIDVSLMLMEPMVVVWYNLAEEAGILDDIDILDKDDEDREARTKAVNALNRARVERMVKKLEGESTESEVMEVAEETLEEAQDEMGMAPQDTAPEAPKGMGLMARRQTSGAVESPNVETTVVEEGEV